MAALIAVPDFWGGLDQGLIHRIEHEVDLEGLAERPAQDIARIPVQHSSQVEPAVCQPDVGDVNGMIANDKFCMIRAARLKLRQSPSSPLCDHPRYSQSKVSGYLLDQVSSDQGGTDEASMDKTSAIQSSSGRGTALGSSISVSAPVDQGD